MSIRFPWPSNDGFPFHVRSLTVDGADRSELIDSAHHRVPIHTAGRWSTVGLSLECQTPGGLPCPDPSVAAVLTNTPAQLRTSSLLHGDNAVQVGTLIVDRESVSFRGHLAIVVTGTVGGVGARLVGRSQPWVIDFDPPREPPVGASPLPIVWESFSKPETGPPILTALGTSPSYVHFREEPPILYLNKDLDQLHDLLMWDTAQLWKRYLRDAISVDIAGKTLASMIRAAFADIVEADDGPEGPYRTSLGNVLEFLVEHLEGVASVDEIRSQVLEGREDSTAAAALESRVAAAVESMTGTSDTFEDFAKKAFE